MELDERVQCRHCGRVVVPRLWLTGGDILKYKTTQHLCPVCGVVMYETGGTYKRVPLIINTVVICLLVAVLLVAAWYYLTH